MGAGPVNLHPDGGGGDAEGLAGLLGGETGGQDEEGAGGAPGWHGADRHHRRRRGDGGQRPLLGAMGIGRLLAGGGVAVGLVG